MTLLYHGTNGMWLDHILKVGLQPRGRRRGNWAHSINSNSKCVYLTDSYAPYFAFNAARGSDPKCTVIEIDTDRLDPTNLFPDEDFLEQASRGDKSVPGTMTQRTIHYRKIQFTYNWICQNPTTGESTTWWQASLRFLGTCSYRGVIPPTAITNPCSVLAA